MTRLTKVRLTLAAFALALGVTALTPPPAAALCIQRICTSSLQCKNWCPSASVASCTNGVCQYQYGVLID
jgi:hypothetical protein